MTDSPWVVKFGNAITLPGFKIPKLCMVEGSESGQRTPPSCTARIEPGHTPSTLQGQVRAGPRPLLQCQQTGARLSLNCPPHNQMGLIMLTLGAILGLLGNFTLQTDQTLPSHLLGEKFGHHCFRRCPPESVTDGGNRCIPLVSCHTITLPCSALAPHLVT